MYCDTDSWLVFLLLAILASKEHGYRYLSSDFFPGDYIPFFYVFFSHRVYICDVIGYYMPVVYGYIWQSAVHFHLTTNCWAVLGKHRPIRGKTVMVAVQRIRSFSTERLFSFQIENGCSFCLLN